MIQIKKLTAGYQDLPIFKDLNLSFDKGEFVSILGPNGSGKSTLLKLIVGYLKPTSGEISVNNRLLKEWESKELAKIITLIPQESFIQYNFTVEEIITMGRFPFVSFWHNYSSKDLDIVNKVMADLDLVRLKDKFINQLSGGEKQRTFIARAIAQDTDFILLDETFSHLDINHQIEILNIMKSLHKNYGKSIIMISHNMNLASNYADRIVILKDGSILADGSPHKVFTPEILERTFDIKLGVVNNPITNKPNIIYP
ncbi:MAG: ABC transporter [Candidatus Cloacimonetes bacterium 4572_65]|nr:MAG: ABC transporter [Candidatus Cloacimonetes bacterium 4572_65]